MEKFDVVSFVTRDPLFAEIAAIKDISALSKEERMKYDVGIRKFRDIICVLEYAVEKGWKQGFEIGVEEGRKMAFEKGKKEAFEDIARNLLAMGYSKTIIMQATVLSKDEIEKL